MKTSDFIKENIGIAAEAMHKDHEVQMAREECYHIATTAIDLHDILKNVSETTGIDGWVAEKISLANDYMKSVKEYLEYELMSGSPDTVARLGEDDGGIGTSSSSIAAAPPVPLFKKRKIVKRNMS
jgi:hypothetical protein